MTLLNKGASFQGWQTPRWLFNYLNAKFGPFTIDAFADDTNALCDRYNTVEEPFRYPWEGRIFANPPWNRAGRDMADGIDAVKYGSADIAVFVLKASVNTIACHKFARQGTIYLPDQRIAFGAPEEIDASTPSIETMIVVFTPESIERSRQHPDTFDVRSFPARALSTAKTIVVDDSANYQ